jgi:hypothetical protein
MIQLQQCYMFGSSAKTAVCLADINRLWSRIWSLACVKQLCTASLVLPVIFQPVDPIREQYGQVNQRENFLSQSKMRCRWPWTKHSTLAYSTGISTTKMLTTPSFPNRFQIIVGGTLKFGSSHWSDFRILLSLSQEGMSPCARSFQRLTSYPLEASLSSF